MRLRNIPGSREAIAVSPFVVPEETLKERRGRWHELFGNDHPICLEIGMGKGRFICDMAVLHPELNFIGIEKYSSVLIRAVEKREQMEDCPNLRFLRMEAEELPSVFAPGEVHAIYLNFSDPWPKDRHAKRRLPGHEFLERYRQVLTGHGQVIFKTDNHDLFRFALETAARDHWNILVNVWDLHRDPVLSEGNVMTEYEERFSSIGNPIHKMVIEAP